MNNVFEPLVQSFLSTFTPVLIFVLFALFALYFLRKGVIILLQFFSLEEHYGHSFNKKTVQGNLEHFVFSQKKKQSSYDDVKVLDRKTGQYHSVNDVLGESIYAKDPMSHMQMRIVQYCENKGISTADCDDAISTLSKRYEFIKNSAGNRISHEQGYQDHDDSDYANQISTRLSIDGYSSSGLSSRISKRKKRGL